MGFLTSDILGTTVFSKPTITYQYLECNSAHPLATFKGFIKGEVLRYVRLCNNLSDFLEKRDSFIESLILRNYTSEEINNATSGINHSDRHTYLTGNLKRKEPPLVLKFTYTLHMRTGLIKQALTKHWHLIADNVQLWKLFPKKLIIAYKRAKIIKDLLVRSRFFENVKPSNQKDYDNTELDALIAAIERFA